jgi:Cu/Ag efflux protein CusF
VARENEWRKIMGTVLKVLWAFLLVASATTASDETEHLLAGRVEKVDAGAHKIVIETESGVDTVYYTEGTKLFGLRPDSNVDDVVPEDSVVVLYREKGGERRTQEIKDIRLSHEIEALEGNVTRVYRYTRLMFVEMSDGEEDVFQIADNAILILHGQLVSMSDLAAQQGERVKVYYTTDLSLKTVQAMAGPSV